MPLRAPMPKQLKAQPAERVENRALARIVPYPQNPRTHSEAQIDLLANLMQRYGVDQPIVVDERGVILKGHGRRLAALQAGFASFPVVVQRGLSDDDKRALRIADNQVALLAGWDQELMRLEAGELRLHGYDMPLLGFDEAALAGFLDTNPGQVDPDEAPPVPAKPVTKSGDLWHLGRHRLLCGDCRDATAVARLANGVTINLAFTSPPYAEQRDYDETSGFKSIHPDGYVEWFAPVAANVARHLAVDGSWFINIKPSGDGLDTSLYVMDLVIAHVREWGWHFATEFCWERNGVPKGVTQRFKNQFEPIYQFTRGRWKMRPDAVRHESPNVPMAGGMGAKKRRHGTTEFMSDVQGRSAAPGEYIGAGLAYPGNRLPTFATSHSATGHAAAFPVGLPEFFCKAFTDTMDVVFDPFCGSGSTLIATEQTGRSGLGCEISPAYCDVAVERWQTFTGKQATMDGQSFEQLKRFRHGKAKRPNPAKRPKPRATMAAAE